MRLLTIEHHASFRRKHSRGAGIAVCSLPCLVLLCCVVACSAPSAVAEVITPAQALATSSWFDPISPTQLINGSGLSSTDPQTILSATHDNNPAAATMWHAGPNDAGLGGPTGNPPVVDDQAVVFVMPGLVDLTNMYIWNQNQVGATTRGVNEFDFLVSSDSDPLSAVFSSVGTFSLTEAGGGAEPAQAFAFASTLTNVRLAKIDINSAQSGALNDYVGLSEVRFGGSLLSTADPTLEVHRSTGRVVLNNTTSGAVSFTTYQLESPSAGALKANSWTSIADNYDAGSPEANQVDPDDNWLKFTQAPSPYTLAEGTAPGGDGITLGIGASIDLGDIWTKTPTEDLILLLLQDDGTNVPVNVSYLDDPVELGDFDYNGIVNELDWASFRTHYGGLNSGLTPAEAYLQGDFDADGDTDLQDFIQFRDAYDADQGQGALTSLMAVPEPVAIAHAFLFGVFLLSSRVRSKSAVMALSVVFIVVTTSGETKALDRNLSGADAYASSVYATGFEASEAFDGLRAPAGSQQNRWASQGTADPQEWIYVDMGTDLQLSRVTLDWEFSDAENFTMRLRTAAQGDPGGAAANPDDGFWSTVASGTSLPGGAGGVTDEYSFDFNTLTTTNLVGAGGTLTVNAMNPTGRYLMIEANTPATTTLFSIWEVAVEDTITPLGLEVNKTTGEIEIVNVSGFAAATDIVAYDIRSPGGSLSSATWDSLGSQGLGGFPAGDGTGNGWEAGDSSNDQLLSEGYLQGFSTVAAQQRISLGNAYDTGIKAEDIMFDYLTSDGSLFSGTVTYVQTNVPGDFDGDGDVDGADFLKWQRDDGTPAGLTAWQSHYGASTTVNAAAVPEPCGLLLTLVAAGVVMSWRRTKTMRGIVLVPGLLLAFAGSLNSLAWAGTPDAIYLFGDNSSLSTENGAAEGEVGQASGATINGYSLDHAGDGSADETFRDLSVLPDTNGQRPVYVNTAALGFPGTALGSTTTGIGISFDGVNDRLRGVGLGNPANGDDLFSGTSYESSYEQILTRSIDGWVRPTTPSSGARQDIVNDTYQFGIHITTNGTWGINFGSDFGQVNTFTFDSGVSVAGTLDASGWAHIQQFTANNNRAALLVNGEVILATPDNTPTYQNATFASPAANDLAIVFGSNLAGDDNFFHGTLDNFRLSVAGDNSGLTVNGRNYGPLDLSVDNDFIAANVVRGDANGDGIVNGDGTGAPSVDDVRFFVDHFLDRQTVLNTAGGQAVVGDITSMTTMADFNGDGITNIRDWIILRQEHVDAAAIAAVDLQQLLLTRAVPEPAGVTLMFAALIAVSGIRLGRQARVRM